VTKLSIDTLKGFKLGGVHYAVREVVPGDDPLNIECFGCAAPGRWEIDAELCQWGIAWDCYVILVNCEYCHRSYAIRYFQTIEDFLS